MNVTLVSSDVELKNILASKNFFSKIDELYEFDKEIIKKLDSSCIILSDEIVPPNELSFLEFKPEQIVFYMLQNHHNSQIDLSVSAICSSKGIILVPTRLTANQVADFIIKTFRNDEDAGTKVITFFSTTANIGTTTTCLSVARSLSESTKSKVGVLILNAWDRGTYQLDFKGKHLNELKGRLANKALSSKEEFYSSFHMYTKDKLYILGGNSDVKLERLYTKEEIEYLIHLARKYFDIVLIDAGSHFDNVNMLQSLYSANMRFLILNQQYKSTIQFKQVYDEVLYPLGYKKTDFLLLINQVIDSSQLSTPKSISDEVDILLLTSIYDIKDGWATELNETMLYDKSELYRNSISQISKSIIGQFNLPLDENSDIGKQKKRWFNFK